MHTASVTNAETGITYYGYSDKGEAEAHKIAMAALFKDALDAHILVSTGKQDHETHD